MATTTTEKSTFLSDRLYDLGKASNPKSNLSMAQAATQMAQEIKNERVKRKDLMNPETLVKSLKYSTILTIKRLNDEGYRYFRMELFFTD